MKFILKALSFRGRLSRSQWWMANLIAVVPFFLLITFKDSLIQGGYISRIDFGKCVIVVWLLGFWLSLSAAAQRSRDLNRSGWYSLLQVVPFYGLIVAYRIAFVKGSAAASDIEKSAAQPSGNSGTH